MKANMKIFFRRWGLLSRCLFGLAVVLMPLDVWAAYIMASTSANKSPAFPLRNSTVRGNIYPYINSVSDIASVRFYIDDPKVSQPPIFEDSTAPFEMLGGAAFDTTQLSNGPHKFTARFLLRSGTSLEHSSGTTLEGTGKSQVITITLDFNVNNDSSPIPTPKPSSTPAPTATPVPTPNPKGVKWYPGHYMLNWMNAGTSAFSKIYGDPNFQGIVAFHAWRELESNKGVYDFAELERELGLAERNGKKYGILLADKTFGSVAATAPCVPDYMLTDPRYEGGQYVTRDSDGEVKTCIAKRWIPAVQDRLIALYTALGARFDREPNFAVVQTEENAVGQAKNSEDYSVGTYTQQLKRGMTALAEAFTRTPVFQKANWGGQVPELFAHAEKIGIGIGGPDLLPTYSTDAYPYYSDYSGRIPLAIDVQSPGIKGYLMSGEFDIRDLFVFGVIDPRGLQVNYLFWSPSENNYYSFDNDVKPVVDAFEGYINSDCPLNINCQ